MGQELAAVLSMLGTLLLVIAVLVGAYYATKYVGKRYQVQGGAEGGSVELLSRRPLGKDQSLVIVRVTGRVFLLGVTAQRIETITELDAADFPAVPATAPAPASFSQVFRDLLKQTPKKPPEGETDHADEP